MTTPEWLDSTANELDARAAIAKQRRGELTSPGDDVTAYTIAAVELQAAAEWLRAFASRVRHDGKTQEHVERARALDAKHA